MMGHSYVPDSFTHGIIIPIIKDKRGDPTNVQNYRPITLSSIVSKIFEYYLLDKYSSFMPSDDLQFGFKHKIGCPNAIFLLRRVIEHFNDKGSNIYIASLDAVKAFYRINHCTLFSTIIKHGLPKCFVDILINWYSRLTVNIRWNNCLSSELCVFSGVRQGGDLSSVLFNMYINPIITSLKSSGLGCHLKRLYVGCILYADDIILLSASVLSLQKMLNICNHVGNNIGVAFNAIKSKCLYIGPNLHIVYRVL